MRQEGVLVAKKDFNMTKTCLPSSKSIQVLAMQVCWSVSVFMKVLTHPILTCNCAVQVF